MSARAAKIALLRDSCGAFTLVGMHIDPARAAEPKEEELPSSGLGAVLALVLFLLAASSYAQDAEERLFLEADSPAPEAQEDRPATVDIEPTSGDAPNPLDPGTPAPTAEEIVEAPDEPLPDEPTEPAKEEVAQEPPQAPPSMAETSPTDTAASTAQVKRSKDAPYKLHRPNFGFAISASPTVGLAAPEFEGAEFGAAVRSMQFQAEYQPAFLQSIGVLGIGVCGTLYKSFTAMSDGLWTWSAGGQIRYQFRYFKEQWVVPTVSFGAEYLMYQLSAAQTGSLFLMYPGFGGMLLLNFLEPSAAAEGFASSGVSRSYLWGEARMQMGSGDITISGIVAQAGIRIEL